MPTSAAWVETRDFPQQAAPKDLYEFFGIPPSPPQELDSNIREKRKRWKSKSSKARSDEGRRTAEAVLHAIRQAEDAIKRGSEVQPFDSPSTPLPPEPTKKPLTVEEAFKELEALLFRNRYRDAMDRLAEYENQWGGQSRFVDYKAYVILEVAQHDAGSLDLPTINGAVDDAQRAVNELGATEARYNTLLDLLDVAGRSAEAETVLATALQQLPQPSASFRVRSLHLLARGVAADFLFVQAVSIAKAEWEDRAMRSEIVQLLLTKAREALPISSDEHLKQYRHIVQVIVWIANGIPECEDAVLPHRMWAVNAGQPIFAGNWQWRAFFGLITGFIALPLVNALQSKPAWKIVLEGPPAPDTKTVFKRRLEAKNRAWFMAAQNQFVFEAHTHARLPWQSQPGMWPEVQPLFNF